MNIRHLLIPLACLLLWSACQPLYVPNHVNAPLMSQGDETQVSMQIGTNGYGLNLAYSPYYHWGLVLNGNTYTTVQDTNLEVKYRHTFGEIGTGYYTRITNILRFETYAGVGAGSTGLNTDRSLYRRFYLQPAFGVSTRIIDAAIVPRAVMVQHTKDRVNGGDTEVDDSGLFFEPFATVRLGMEQLKFQLQAGFSVPLNDFNFDYQNFTIGFGIHLTFVKDFDRYEQ